MTFLIVIDMSRGPLIMGRGLDHLWTRAISRISKRDIRPAESQAPEKTVMHLIWGELGVWTPPQSGRHPPNPCP